VVLRVEIDTRAVEVSPNHREREGL